MQWNSPHSIPPQAGVYRVQVPVPAVDYAFEVEEHFARWTGEHWTCWADTIARAAQCAWRGPSAGYLWAELCG